MQNREKLITYALMCNGDYFKIKKMILENKDVEDLSKGVDAITILDEVYPKSLFQLKCPPFVLFYRGNINLLNKKTIGIVGCKQTFNDYPVSVTKQICEKTDKVIVTTTPSNGFGLDIEGHALFYSKESILVMKCGIDVIPNNSDIWKNKVGLYISEYPNKVEKTNGDYGRIVAGLSDKLYVMAISEKGYANDVVSETLNIGKEIKVLPYNLVEDMEVRNNYLINDGASAILDEDVLDKKTK